MQVNIVDKAFPKNMEKLINKLLKTAIKYSGFRIKKSQVSISFVNSDEIKRLNKKFRNIDSKTDVLSFPNLQLTPGVKISKKDYSLDIDPKTKNLVLGDIVICEEVAKNNAEEYGHSYERELCYLIIHGFLHLLGYDHIKDDDKIIMRAYEEAVLRKYNIARNIA